MADINLEGASAWDTAVRYHEFKQNQPNKELIKKARSIATAGVIRRAQQLLGSVSRSTLKKSVPLSEIQSLQDGEIDLDETLLSTDIWLTVEERRKHSIILSVDTSLSMTGEKLALTAVAIAVVLLQFSEDNVGVVVFDDSARILKHPSEKTVLQKVIERFLDIPGRGYTNLEEGLKLSMKLAKQVTKGQRAGRRAATVLLTDGKYTAGSDPGYLADKFSKLILMQMGKDRAGTGLCSDLARNGGGQVYRVPMLGSLPKIMYRVVKDLLIRSD
ncbi:MAG: hypothetical protein A3K03_03790 [Bdellovibrionales bacterium RIFOXYD1_FULL_44_7]|nr:MAG: hypothetical protein A3K03_03790 [Bdellovibrionales bacterium RIFOXYD1_FULL_44_7]